jgi:hypothetical protein
LPTCATDWLNEGINLLDDSLDHQRDPPGLVFIKYLSQGTRSGINDLDLTKSALVVGAFSLEEVFRQFEKVAQKFDTLRGTGYSTKAKQFEPLRERFPHLHSVWASKPGSDSFLESLQYLESCRRRLASLTGGPLAWHD